MWEINKCEMKMTIKLIISVFVFPYKHITTALLHYVKTIFPAQDIINNQQCFTMFYPFYYYFQDRISQADFLRWNT